MVALERIQLIHVDVGVLQLLVQLLVVLLEQLHVKVSRVSVAQVTEGRLIERDGRLVAFLCKHLRAYNGLSGLDEAILVAKGTLCSFHDPSQLRPVLQVSIEDFHAVHSVALRLVWVHDVARVGAGSGASLPS